MKSPLKNTEPLKYSYKGKKFKTSIAQQNYIKTEISLKEAKKNKESKKIIKMLKGFMKGWEGY